MSPDTLGAFEAAMDSALAATDIRCLVITGTGSCFSAGANLTGELQRDDGKGAPPSAKSFAMYAPFLRVLDIPVPVIAAMNGHAVGGGFGLTLLCDIRVANRDARYGANFARLGIHSGLAISHTLPQLVGMAHASEMLFTGDLITGARAAEIGLANHAVSAEEVLPTSLGIASRIAGAAPLAVAGMKRTMRAGVDGAIRAAAHVEAFAQAESLSTADAKEGVAAMLGKREPVFVGA